MSLLQRTITLDELERWGAGDLYDAALIKRWMRNRPGLRVDEVLDARGAGLSRIFWTVMREEVLPAGLLHACAVHLARHFLARLEADGVPVDFRSHAALDVKDRFTGGHASLGEVAAAHEAARRARDDHGARADWEAARNDREADYRAATGANAVVHALEPDGRTAVRGVLYALLDVYAEDDAGAAVHDLVAKTVGAYAAAVPTPATAPTERGEVEAAAPQPDAFAGDDAGAVEAEMSVAVDGSEQRSEPMPVGTILAYAGLDARAVEAEGWLLCDGRSLHRETYKALYDAIGTAFGTARPDSFNLPQLQGLFMRGVSDTSGRDPDANSRVPLQPGGNFGNAVGSLQTYATGRPRRANFTKRVTSIDSTRVDKGCGNRAAEFNTGSEPLTVTGGGDRETRPVNRYVYFIVKYRTHLDSGAPVVPPIGAVFPFAGVNVPASIRGNWVLCDGVPKEGGAEFKPLFNAIGYAHGNPGAGKFNLPDYRGAFLRGVDGGRGYDPDARTRTPVKPGGNSGDLVGSAQGGATGLPQTPFGSSFPNLPVREGAKGIAGLIYEVYSWSWGSPEMDLTQAGGGGDAESRPLNLSVDWYVRFA